MLWTGWQHFERRVSAGRVAAHFRRSVASASHTCSPAQADQPSPSDATRRPPAPPPASAREIAALYCFHWGFRVPFPRRQRGRGARELTRRSCKSLALVRAVCPVQARARRPFRPGAVAAWQGNPPPVPVRHAPPWLALEPQEAARTARGSPIRWRASVGRTLPQNAVPKSRKRRPRTTASSPSMS